MAEQNRNNLQNAGPQIREEWTRDNKAARLVALVEPSSDGATMNSVDLAKESTQQSMLDVLNNMANAGQAAPQTSNAVAITNPPTAQSPWPFSDSETQDLLQAILNQLQGNTAVSDPALLAKVEACRALLAGTIAFSNPHLNADMSSLISAVNAVLSELQTGPVPVTLPSNQQVSATIVNQLTGVALDTSVAPLHGDLGTIHADLAQIHTDTGTTLHGDLTTLIGKVATEATLAAIKALLPTALGTNGGLKVEFAGSQTVTANISGVAQDASVLAGNTLLTAIKNAVTAALHVIIDSGAVTVSSSALPSGASTSALQTSGNSSLSSIDGKTPALGQALAGASVPVVLPSAQLATLTPPTHVSLDAGTNSIGKVTMDNVDIALSALRDALRGANSKTLSDVVTALTGSLTLSNAFNLEATQLLIKALLGAGLPAALSANLGLKTEDQWAVYTPYPFGGSGEVVPAGTGANAGKSIEVACVSYSGIGTVTIKDGSGKVWDGGRALSAFTTVMLNPVNGWKYFTTTAGQNLQVTAAILGVITAPTVSGTVWARYV